MLRIGTIEFKRTGLHEYIKSDTHFFIRSGLWDSGSKRQDSITHKIRLLAYRLAMCEANTSIFEWLSQPVKDLSSWIEIINQENERINKENKSR